MPITIATWNVNSLRVRMAHVQAFLQQHQPTVLLLQETKVDDDQFPLDDFLMHGYHVAFHGQKSYNGVAILSKLPLSHITTGFNGHNLNEQTRVLTATIGTGADALTAVTAYCVNGETITSPKFALKQEFYQHLTTYVHGLTQGPTPVVVGGDFNIATDARDVDDVAKRERDVLFTPTERQWLQTFKEKTGLTDAFRHLHSEGGIFSWWDYRAGAVEQNRGLRIDYLYVSPSLLPRLTAVVHHADERTKPQPSDHIPVSLTLA